MRPQTGRFFARGLRAGLWLVRQAPGRHHMAEIFI